MSFPMNKMNYRFAVLLYKINDNYDEETQYLLPDNICSEEEMFTNVKNILNHFGQGYAEIFDMWHEKTYAKIEI